MPLPEHLVELDRRYRASLDHAVEALRNRFEERLRTASDELVRTLRSESAELPAAELLDDLDLARLEAAPRRAGERAGLAGLHEAIVAFDRAESQRAVLEALLAGARRFAPRAGVLLTSTDGVTGWGGTGFGDSGGDPLAGRESGWDGAGLEVLARGRGCVVVRGTEATELAARLGLPAAEEAALVPLVLRDTVAAALYADRRPGEAELALEGLQLLALGAAQRLELQALSDRPQTPTLFLAAAESGAGLGLWNSGAAAVPAGAADLAAGTHEPPVAAIEESLPTEAERLDSTGVEELFSLSSAPERIESPVEEPAELRAAPVADLSAYEPERVLALEPEVPSAATEAPADFELAPAGEPVFELESEPAAAGEPGLALAPVGEPVFELEPEPSAAAAEEPVFEVEPEPEPALELGWEMEDSEATVFQPSAAGPEVEPARAETTAPFELPGASTRDLPLPSGATWSALPPIEADLPAPAAPGLETRALPIAPHLEPEPVEDATVMISRGATPAPAADTSEDATVMVSRVDAPRADADLTEDATALVQRPPVPPPPPPSSEVTEEPTHPNLAARAAAEEEPGERTHARAPRTTEVAPPPDLQGPGLAFTTGRIQRATGENALHEEARRLARLLISEIKLYNEEQVDEGRRHRDLYLRLKEDIDRSRQIYDERVHDSVRDTSDYFQQELIRSLAGGDPRALGI